MTPTTTEFKLEYIKRQARINANHAEKPAWENKINEIRNNLSQLIDTIRVIIPGYSNYTESFGCHEWTPFWIAVLEIQDQFRLPGDNSDIEYKINHVTLEITLAKE